MCTPVWNIPRPLRTTLTLGRIMAVADAQAATLFGALSLDGGAKWTRAQGWLLLASRPRS